MKNVAVVFRRLGPYHVARLLAASRLVNLSVVEYATSDKTYGWRKMEGELSLRRYVVTEDTPRTVAEKKVASLRIHSILSEIAPSFCALPGWAMPEALSGLNWCLAHEVPAIVMSDSTHIDRTRSIWKEWIKRLIVRQYSAALVGGTPQAEYIKRLGMEARGVYLGYDVVDNDYFEYHAKRVRTDVAGYRFKYSLPEKYFLASARFIPKKNLTRLLHAYKDYLRIVSANNSRAQEKRTKSNKPWHLVMLGDGPLRSELEEVASEIGITNYIHFPGFKQYEELPIYYALANAFIHASVSEQWGLVVNEAMACGLPVLVSNRCGCAQDLIRDDINGYQFDPFDINDISRCMIDMHSMDESTRARMGEASSALIKEWGPSRFAHGLVEAVNHAMSKPKVRTSKITKNIINGLIYA